MAASTMSVDLSLAVPPQKLWKALKDNQLLPKAVQPVVVGVEESKEASGFEIGATRVVKFNPELVGFPYVKEKLVAYDEANMTIGSSVIEGGFVGTQLKSHTGTVTLKPEGEGTLVHWVCEYEPLVNNPDVDKVKEGYIGTMKAIEAYIVSNPDY